MAEYGQPGRAKADALRSSLAPPIDERNGLKVGRLMWDQGGPIR
jgi:hypothetical protein